MASPSISPGRLEILTKQWFINDIPGIFANYKVSPDHAERALALVSPCSCGVCSIANPHLNDDSGTIIAFPDETFGLGVKGSIVALVKGVTPLPAHHEYRSKMN
jgi:hypothetical protein